MMVKSLFGIFAWMVLVPVGLCLLFRPGWLGSIGPLVPLLGVASVVVLPFLLLKGIQETAICVKWPKYIVGVAIIIGVLLSVLQVNIFMLLTYVFGIMDYQMM